MTDTFSLIFWRGKCLPFRDCIEYGMSIEDTSYEKNQLRAKNFSLIDTQAALKARKNLDDVY